MSPHRSALPKKERKMITKHLVALAGALAFLVSHADDNLAAQGREPECRWTVIGDTMGATTDQNWAAGIRRNARNTNFLVQKPRGTTMTPEVTLLFGKALNLSPELPSGTYVEDLVGEKRMRFDPQSERYRTTITSLFKKSTRRPLYFVAVQRQMVAGIQFVVSLTNPIQVTCQPASKGRPNRKPAPSRN